MIAELIALSDVAERFPNAHPKGPNPQAWEWEADCPAAAHRATGIKDKIVGRFDEHDGREVVHCVAGCSPADLAMAVGLSPDDIRMDLTIAALADAFLLPVEHLNAWGLRDVQVPVRGVAIPHQTASGEAVHQYRLRLHDAAEVHNQFDKRFHVPRGTVLPAFGGDHLDGAQEAVLVEGSSDVLTLTFAGFTALGIPGQTNAKALRAEHVAKLKRIVVFREPDATFVRQVAKQLRTLRWKGELRVLDAAEIGAKDPAALWQRLRAEGDSDEVARDRFRSIMEPALANATPPTAEDEAGESTVDPGLVAELNRELAVLREPAGLLLYEPRDGGRYQLKKPHELRPLFANRPGCDGDLLDWWLGQRERRELGRITFAPGAETPHDYNLWRGWAVEPVAGSAAMFWTLTREVICANDPDKLLYVRKWLAHMVQHPAELPEVALVLRSVEGTGKNVFVDYVGKLVGRHFKTLSNMDELTGQFNSHLADALLVFANEAVWGGDKRRQGPLKALITDTSCKLEAKGKDAVFVRNYKRIIAASNADHPVPVDRGDRRYALFDVARSRKEDYTFFEAVVAERDEAGPSALMHDLLHEDLTDWNPRNRPESTRPVELQQRSASPIQSWLQDALFEGAIVFEGTVTEAAGEGMRSYKDRIAHPWDGEVPKDDLYDAYVQACRRTHARPDGNALFFKALADAERGYGVLIPNAERKLRIGETRKRVVRVRPLDEARAAFSEHTGLGPTIWDGAEPGPEPEPPF